MQRAALQNPQSTTVNMNFRQSLDALNRATLELYEKYEWDSSVDFRLSKFLGKAFISFEYQQFSYIVEELSRNQQLQLKDSMLIAERAAPPEDVNW